MRPNRPIPYLVNAKLWELSTDALPQFPSELYLILIVLSNIQYWLFAKVNYSNLEMVDMNVKTTTFTIIDRLYKAVISFAKNVG